MSRLGDYLILVTKGTTPTTLGEPFTDQGINFIKAESITSTGMLDHSYFSHISKETNDKMSRSKLEEGDLVMSIAGNLGRVAKIRALDLPANTNQAVGIIRPDKKKIHSDYLKYRLMTTEAQKKIKYSNAQSVQNNINLDNIRNLEITIHDLETQDIISNVLSSIDRKIENNNNLSSELESLAKTIYDYWFVQFDFPDENGKPYKSSGGKMVYNEELKREIPVGWKVKPLGEYISVIRGVSYKPADELKQNSENSISLLKSNNIQNGTINFEQPVFLPQHLADKNQWLTEGSVFITMSSGSKAHMGKTAIVYKNLPYVFGAFCAKIIIDDSVRGYLSTYFRSEWFRVYIENVTAGTSINNIGNDQLTSILLPFPTREIQKRFEDYLKPIFARQGELRAENQQLASLRDWLLPMLMNGQVTFK